MLFFVAHGSGFVVFASNAGDDADPSWWRNLDAKPQARVPANGETVSVTARRLEGAEREEAWSGAAAVYPDYEEYRLRTSRPIPVVLLERTG